VVFIAQQSFSFLTGYEYGSHGILLIVLVFPKLMLG